MPVLFQTVVNASPKLARDGQAPETIVTSITFSHVKLYNTCDDICLYCYHCVVGSAVTDFQLDFVYGIMAIGLS